MDRASPHASAKLLALSLCPIPYVHRLRAPAAACHTPPPISVHSEHIRPINYLCHDCSSAVVCIRVFAVHGPIHSLDLGMVNRRTHFPSQALSHDAQWGSSEWARRANM